MNAVFGLNIQPDHGHFVDTEMVGGNFDCVELVDPTPDGGYTPQGLLSGRHIKTGGLPTRMKWLDPNGHPVPDFDRQFCINVSERAKAVIEGIEPGVHQFAPIEYVDRHGRHIEDRYLLIVGNRIDSLDHERTTLVLVAGRMWMPAADLAERPDLIPPGFNVGTQPKLVFSLDKIGTASMWCDKHLSTAGPFISVSLADALQRSGCTGLRLDDAKAEAV